MRSYKEYIEVPEGFKFDYISGVYNNIFPILFLISMIMIIVSLLVIYIGMLQLITESISKNQRILNPKTKIGLGFFLLFISVFYSRWYIVVFFPDGILKMVL